MTEQPIYRLGDLQLRIMRVLWRLGPTGVAEVRQHLGGDQLAYTTVATMLRKMENRGLVRHREDHRRFIYDVTVSAEAVTQCMADDLVDRLFQGSLADAVTHLIQSREVSHEELDRLEDLIRQRRERG